MELVRCENLSIGYGSDVIQSQISFSIDQGSYVCVVGENGAGKSTLIKTLLGLIPILNGSLFIDDSIKSEGIGYLPQQGVFQRNFPTSVREVILSGLQNKIKLFYTKADKDFITYLASKFGIEDLLDKRYSDLSGGQQQRVLLVRALCVSDKFLVFDEPVTGLDMQNQELFYNTVSELNKNGTTILMISHDLNVFSQDISHVLCVNSNCVQYMPTKDYILGGYNKNGKDN